MGKARVTVYVCAGKDCRKAWHRLGEDTPGKWLKKQVERAGLPYKLNVVATDCQDHCEQAACLCFVAGECAGLETHVRSRHDADRLLATLRACAERAAAGSALAAE
jgi:hypothetical protein